MDGKLCNNMSKKEVAVILSSWVDTLLWKEAGPGKGHESTKLSSLTLVVRVMDVRGSVFN